MRLKLPFDLKEIKPGEFSYLTKRRLEDKDGVETGELFIWRKTGDEEYRYIMLCPFCEEEQEGAAIFTRRPYRIRCSNCGKSILIKKLKDEAKGK
ncbi:MAG: hypothetical protein ACE5PM_06545 [Candidatus Hydrothermarchaeales archaeon]